MFYNQKSYGITMSDRVKKTGLKDSEHAVYVYGNDHAVDMLQASFWKNSMRWAWPLLPFCVEEVKRRQPYRFREDHCQFMILVLLLDGRLQYECEAKRYPLRAGDLLILPQNSCYTFSSGRLPSYYHKIVLEVKGSHLPMICSALSLSGCQSLHLSDPGMLEEKFRRIRQWLSEPSPETVAPLLGLTMEILVEVSLRIREKHTESSLLYQVQAYLENDQESGFSLPQLAEKMGSSSATLNRLFRQHLQTSPAQFRIERKIEQAKYFLQHTSLSIKEIAARLGYCNQFYFSKEFKRKAGVSPSQFRQNSR